VLSTGKREQDSFGREQQIDQPTKLRTSAKAEHFRESEKSSYFSFEDARANSAQDFRKQSELKKSGASHSPV
jgi:hypothetical protein